MRYIKQSLTVSSILRLVELSDAEQIDVEEVLVAGLLGVLVSLGAGVGIGTEYKPSVEGGGKGECFRGAGTGTGTFVGSSALVSFETFLGGASGFFGTSGLGLTGLGGGRGLESPPEELLANGTGRGGFSGEGDSFCSLYN